VFKQFFEIMKEIQKNNDRNQNKNDPQLPISGSPATTYKVDAIELGEHIDLTADRFRGYSCIPSDSYANHSFCKLTKKEREARGEFTSTSSFLLSPDGRANYANHSIAPAFWNPGEVQTDITKLIKGIR
jgi:hypothetical protein